MHLTFFFFTVKNQQTRAHWKINKTWSQYPENDRSYWAARWIINLNLRNVQF